MPGMNRTKSRRGQPYTALTVHGLFTIHGPVDMQILQSGRMYYTWAIQTPNIFSKLVHFFWTSIPPSGTAQTSCQHGRVF